MRITEHDLANNLRDKLDRERLDRATAEAKLWKTEERLKIVEENLAYQERRAAMLEESVANLKLALEREEKRSEDAASGRNAVLASYMGLIHAS